MALAIDGHDGLRQFHKVRPDVVVLDVGLPNLDGWQVLERIRIMSETPVLMLTALGTERDKVGGLDGGADDYLVKPFSRAELVARVRALGRRHRVQMDEADSFDDGPLHIDHVGHCVEQDGKPVSLTRTEFNLLSVLSVLSVLSALSVLTVHKVHKGQVLSPDQLIERAWLDPSGLAPGKVKFAVRRLREAMGWDKDGGPLETVRGVGYCYRGFAAKKRQLQARIRAFCASNSASVRIPCDLSSARSLSWATVSLAGAVGAGAGGGAAYCGCCWAYCCSSCCAQRFACRRDTRFETAVAVPAIAAVRAIPLRSGMVLPFSSRPLRARRRGRLGGRIRRQ